jgi:hypothetical protein
MIALTIDNVDGFVTKLQRKGIDVRWDGWDMVFFNENKGALRNPAGRRLGNRWGFETTVSPDAQGQWLINHRLARGN